MARTVEMIDINKAPLKDEWKYKCNQLFDFRSSSL